MIAGRIPIMGDRKIRAEGTSGTDPIDLSFVVNTPSYSYDDPKDYYDCLKFMDMESLRRDRNPSELLFREVSFSENGWRQYVVLHGNRDACYCCGKEFGVTVIVEDYGRETRLFFCSEGCRNSYMDDNDLVYCVHCNIITLKELFSFVQERCVECCIRDFGMYSERRVVRRKCAMCPSWYRVVVDIRTVFGLLVLKGICTRCQEEM